MLRSFSFLIVLALLVGCDAQGPLADLSDTAPRSSSSGSLSIYGPSSAQVGAFYQWGANVTPPSGANETGRTWQVDDGNGVIHQESGTSLTYAFEYAPDNSVGYHIIAYAHFSDGTSRGNIYPVDVAGGPGGGGPGNGGGCTAIVC